MVRIINAEDRTVADHHFAAGIDEAAPRDTWRSSGRAAADSGDCACSSTNHADGIAMKFIDRGPELSEGFPQPLFFLPLHSDLYERHRTERQDRHHGDRNNQLDQREAEFTAT